MAKKKRTRKSNWVTFVIDRELRERLERRAEREDRSLSASLRQALVRDLEAQEKTA